MSALLVDSPLVPFPLKQQDKNYACESHWSAAASMISIKSLRDASVRGRTAVAVFEQALACYTHSESSGVRLGTVPP